MQNYTNVYYFLVLKLSFSLSTKLVKYIFFIENVLCIRSKVSRFYFWH